MLYKPRRDGASRFHHPLRARRLLAVLVFLVAAPSAPWRFPCGDSVTIAEGAVFGSQTVYATNLSAENVICCGRYTPASNGTADSITVYLDFFSDAVATNVKCSLYDFAGGTPAKVDTTEQRTVDCAVSCPDGWYVFDFPGTVSVSSSVTYDICVWASLTTNACNTKNQTTGGTAVDFDGETYGVWPDPLVETNLANRPMSIYCTYTPTATALPKRRRKIIQERGASSLLWEAKSTFAGFETGEVAK
jgi:hypothetical protein